VFQEEVTIRIKHTAIINNANDTFNLTLLTATDSSNEFKPMAGGCFIPEFAILKMKEFCYKSIGSKTYKCKVFYRHINPPDFIWEVVVVLTKNNVATIKVGIMMVTLA
jgi:hypothetical protein